jgi:hypothetical protein
MSRVLCFTSPHFAGQQQSPGVAIFREGAVTVCAWAPTAKDAIAVALRAQSVREPPMIIAKRLNFLEFQEAVINHTGRSVSQLRGRMFQLSTDPIPKAPWLMTPEDIFAEARKKPLEQVYFAVGGPISCGQTASKVTGFVIP